MDEKEQETASEIKDAEESEVASANEGNKPNGLAERTRNFKAKRESLFTTFRVRFKLNDRLI